MQKDLQNTEVIRPVCPYQIENTLELFQIWGAIKQNWKGCIFIVIIFTLFSILVSILLPKQYLVKSVLLPPTESSVNKLNIPEYYQLTSTEVNIQLTGEKIYFLFLDNLRSTDMFYQFFKSNNLVEKFNFLQGKDYDEGKIFEEEFVQKLNIDYKEGLKGDTKFITVELQGRDPVETAGWLNNYISFTDQQTIKAIEDSIKSRIIAEKDSVTKKISSLRIVAEKNRRNILEKITEDLKIAVELHMIDTADVSFNYFNQNINSEAGVIGNIQGTPGYLKGINILKAELTSVKNRKNNDPFIPGLQKLLEKKEYLDKVERLTFNDVHAARIDKIAAPNNNPSKPNKLLIIIVGTFFGILASIFFILLKVLLDKHTLKN